MFVKKEVKNNRFKACLELNEVDRKLSELQIRTDNMRDAAKELSSISYQKFRVLDGLLSHINNLIAEFNKNIRKFKNEEERVDALHLLFDINSLINKISVDEMKILLSFRDNTRQNAQSVIKFGFMGAGAAAGAFFLGPFAAVGLCVGGSVVGNLTNYYTGLLDILPDSMTVFLQFNTALVKAINACMTDASDFHKAEWLESIQFKDTILEHEMKVDVIYLTRDDKNDFVHFIWRDKNSQIKKINLNDFLPENDRYKNFPGFKNIAESEFKNFYAAFFVSILRFQESVYESYRNEHQCITNPLLVLS